MGITYNNGMAIEVTCDNILRYDPVTGNYARCKHRFSVRDELRGGHAECPHCGSSVVVPVASEAPQENSVDLSELFTSSEATPSPNTSEHFADFADDQFKLEDISLDAPKAWSDDLMASASSLPYPAVSDTGTPQIKGVSQATGSAVDKTAVSTQNCSDCGAPLKPGELICDACGYHSGWNRRVDGWVLEDNTPTETGFRLWLSGMLNEGESITKLLYLGWGVGSLLMLYVSAMLTSLFGNVSALVIFPIYIVGVIFSLLIVIVLTTGKNQTKSSVLWNMMLILARLFAWRSISWPFRVLRLGNYHRRSLNDKQLAELADLGELEVLDLGGTQVSDESVGLLKRLRPTLRCLVLRNTHITPEAVDDLQQALPQVWIWY